MKYLGMPMGMWTMFAGSFQKQLTAVFGYDSDTAKGIAQSAKPKYKAIISDLPEFEKADRFKMNIVNCAMLGAFIFPCRIVRTWTAGGLLRQCHDDKAHAVVLSQ
jgi:hypothetical protein